MNYSVRPIAYIRNERSEALDDNWDDVLSTVELAQDVPSEALRGLSEFSHVEIVFFADWAEDVPPGPWHRHPRGNTEWPDVGVFAQRNKDRPNRILLTTVAIDSIDESAVSTASTGPRYSTSSPCFAGAFRGATCGWRRG